MKKGVQKKRIKKKPTVIDFFCGAGGFSEGFKQEGFEIVLAIDHWKPAIDTFNYNFQKNFEPRNILTISSSTKEIENLPNTDVIIGSPPCVSFSNSNNSGKADKSLGVKLTEAFLRIVAVKKHKKRSKLKAWFMENVTNSTRYLQPTYTFQDLKLTDWAKKNRISPQKIAISLLGNTSIINSADYGSVQVRKRVVSGEILNRGKLVIAKPTHDKTNSKNDLLPYKTLSQVRQHFPSPFEDLSDDLILDPVYGFSIKKSDITDHFYDTGIYECDWKNSEYQKICHPYMGKMSFPENFNKPSRTITATNIVNSRESIIYKAEINRSGNGEYRSPTVREAAIIMGFPISYQFIGSESAKLRLIGNAVCPSVSSAFAREVRKSMRLSVINKKNISRSVDLTDVPNLNTYSVSIFDNPPVKNKGARFRRHPFKEGNMTIALTNYSIAKNNRKAGKWRVYAFYGTGEGFKVSKYDENYYNSLKPVINKFQRGGEFIKIIHNGFSEKIANAKLIQKMYEQRSSIEDYLGPTALIDEVGRIVNRFVKKGEIYEQGSTKIFKRKSVPKRHLYALYAINLIVTNANKKK